MHNKLYVVVLIAVVLFAFTGAHALAGDVDCGNIGGAAIRVASVSDSMDEKVWACSGDWSACCATCGTNLQNAGKLKQGWSCSQSIPGIWLRGCEITGSCK